MRKWLLLLLAVLMCLPMTAYAVDVDYTKSGTLEIELTTSHQISLFGQEISLYRIGEVENPHGDLKYYVSGEFASCNVDLNYTTANEAAEAAQEISDFISAHNIKPSMTKRTDTDGNATFSDLSVGVYFGQKTGGSSEISMLPFIVTVPYYKDTELLYTVPVNPKTEYHPQPTTAPTPEPTTEPTGEPTTEPTQTPTPEPTSAPTLEPTEKPAPTPGDVVKTGVDDMWQKYLFSAAGIMLIGIICALLLKRTADKKTK